MPSPAVPILRLRLHPERDVQHRRLAVHRPRHRLLPQRRVHASRQLRGSLGRPPLVFAVRDDLQARRTRGRRQRICVVRARMRDTVPAVPRERYVLNDLRFASHRPARQTAGEYLGHRRHVRGNPVRLLRAARADAESRNHLVEDQHDVVLARQLERRTHVVDIDRLCAKVRARPFEDHRRDRTAVFA